MGSTCLGWSIPDSAALINLEYDNRNNRMELKIRITSPTELESAAGKSA